MPSKLWWLWPANPRGIDWMLQFSILAIHYFTFKEGENPCCSCLTGRKQTLINAIFFITSSLGFLPTGSIWNDLFHTQKMSLIWQLNQSSWHSYWWVYRILMQYPYFMLFNMTVTMIDPSILPTNSILQNSDTGIFQGSQLLNPMWSQMFIKSRIYQEVR